jgi:hypothetical protein
MIDLDKLQKSDFYKNDIVEIDRLVEELNKKIQNEFENTGNQNVLWLLKKDQDKLYKKV